jgi:putative glutamine amidotransferase
MNSRKESGSCFRKLIGYSALTLLLSIFFISCGGEKPVIVFSKATESPSYQKYVQWINESGDYKCLNLYGLPLDSAIKLIASSDGIVLTGGPDVHPVRYGRSERDTARCEIDLMRDTLEFALIQYALDSRLPILAICRGEQILNVALGGTLIVDIPQDYGTSVQHRCPEPDTCYHNVTIDTTTQFYNLAGVKSGIVNTNHHQAVGMMASSLKSSAIADDGIVEAYEWQKPAGKSFLIAVQWHPERLGNSSPLSLNIRETFLKAVKSYQDTVKR